MGYRTSSGSSPGSDRGRVMTEETIRITDEVRKSEEDSVRIKYYTLDGNRPEIYMCPGDLIVICNVLHGYYNAETENEIIEIVEKGGIE